MGRRAASDDKDNEKGGTGSCPSDASGAQRPTRSEADNGRLKRGISRNRSQSPKRRVSFYSNATLERQDEEAEKSAPAAESQISTRKTLAMMKTASMPLQQLTVGESCVWDSKITPPTPPEEKEESTASI